MRSTEQGGKNMEQGEEEHRVGGRSMEQGVGSRMGRNTEQGGGSMEQGVGSRVGRNMEQGGRSMEQDGRSTEQGGRSTSFSSSSWKQSRQASLEGPNLPTSQLWVPAGSTICPVSS